MNDTERKVTIFALSSLMDDISCGDSDMSTRRARSIIECMICYGIPGIYEDDIAGVRDIIRNAINELEEMEEGNI